MTHKVGRNDPCPCGSGKKHKQCCGRTAAPAVVREDSHEGAVGRALAWLRQYHRKAFAQALETEIDAAVFAVFDEDAEAADAAFDAMDDELGQQLEINLTEWLLAEGDIDVKGERRCIAELLTAPGGPLFTVGQRAWIEQLARRPLRLYDVTDVVPGESMTLCDAIDTEQPPQVVIERAGSRAVHVGMQLGVRVMEVAGQCQLSGANYPLSLWGGRAVQDRLRKLLAEPSRHPEDDILMTGLCIIEGWLAQYLLPAPLPDIVHGPSGEPLLFTTDHYDVRAWPALTAALAAQPDVHGDRDAGWDRLVDGADGLTRSQATITAQPGGRRVAVRYPTVGLAEQGRRWFEALAGGSVKFVLRELSDPKGLLSGARKGEPVDAPDRPEGLDGEGLAAAMEDIVKRMYAHWADEPIPALNGQTPRQAIASAAGLERVKGLLRYYEEGEAEQAAQQGRREVSYQFLWDALALPR